MNRLTIAIALALTSLNAWAGIQPVPEPDVLSLFAVGAVGGLALWLRNRHKK